jgi:hypothetical protein
LNYAIDHNYLPADTRLQNALKKVKAVESIDNLMSPEKFEEGYSRASNKIKGR